MRRRRRRRLSPSHRLGATGSPDLSDDGRVTFLSDRSGEVGDLDRKARWRRKPFSSRTRAAIPGFPRFYTRTAHWSRFTRMQRNTRTARVYVVPSEGGPVRNVTRAASTDTFPSFSHDGASIYFNSSSERRSHSSGKFRPRAVRP